MILLLTPKTMTNFQSYVAITRKTKANRKGSHIRCSNCKRIERVIYDMKWKEETCRFCHKTSDKYEWLIEESLYR